MDRYAEIIVKNNSIHTDTVYSYKIPDHLEDILKPGHRVLVPFGRGNKPVEGYVFRIGRITNECPDNMKDIVDVLDENPIFSENQLELIKWMRNRYLCTYMDCINVMHPKGINIKNYRVVYPGEKISRISGAEIYEIIKNLSENEKKVIESLLNGKERIEENKIRGIENLTELLYRMKNKGLIQLKWEYKSRKNEKKLCIVSISDEIENIDIYIEKNKIRLGKRQKDIIEFLKLNDSSEINDIMEILKVSSRSIKSLNEKGLVKFRYEDYYRKPDSVYQSDRKKIVLNEEQKYVSETIKNEMFDEGKKPYMIHGVTGSGKTEVYMDIIEYALSQGLDSILLVPEISLTPQTVARIKNRFGDIVGVFHSQLSEGEKHDVFKSVENGDTRILIGARSAIFAPFKSLGLVIIDEFHESSYKSEKNPKFSTIEVARFMAYKWKITLIMGSATPSVEEYYRAENGEYKLLEIKKRANEKPLPKIETVDMREELEYGNKSIFSRKMIKEIRNAYEKGEQSIVFLNRRGYANFVSCRSCGYVAKCPNCDISLTYHKGINSIRCHYCGYEIKMPAECPECKSPYIKPFGTGTQRIEEELQNLIPGIKVLRMDKDTTSKKGAFDDILKRFSKKEADVLVGTQMITKGLDFDNVTVVGIVSADMMLNFPDFRSFETTFQIITQVAGRAGRAQKDGKVILQTYNTEHYAIKNAMDYDFESFYRNEIKIRKAFEYAPFNNMISVVISGENEGIVKRNIHSMYNSIVYLLKERGYTDFEFMLGPNPCPISKINRNYRWQILFRDEGVEINLLKGIIRYVCITKRDSVFDKNINISIDINPNSIL